MSVNTSKVTGRRQLKFQSLDEVLADAERCAGEGYRPLGNWSAGQIFAHIARAMHGSIDGMPFQVPWLIRCVLTLFRKRYINGPISPGVTLPSTAKSLIAEPSVSTEQGLADLRQAIARLKQTAARAPSPAFGVMSREDSDRLHMTHAAMHLSFLIPAHDGDHE
ncbi:MAG: DUF1569 domain-containing protein [Planctomycetaceae bacterium]|nr:DUF1569 domain-containing protein [Planctomycetaceae bacterium]